MNKSDKIRFVCISDTHGLTEKLKVPSGDVLIHAGDFTNYGESEMVTEFNDWLGTLPHPVKIVIAGNHEITFDTKNLPRLSEKYLGGVKIDSQKIKSLLTNCIYLEDNSVTIHGYKIYGSPWGWFSRGSGFNTDTDQELMDAWSKIPSDTDILITHLPPYGALDLVYPRKHVGDRALMKEVKERVKPIAHIFGHIHEGYGAVQQDGVLFINAAICTVQYEPNNRPIVFELPIREKEIQKSSMTKEK